MTLPEEGRACSLRYCSHNWNDRLEKNYWDLRLAKIRAAQTTQANSAGALFFYFSLLKIENNL